MEKEILIQELVKIIHKNCKLSVEEIATMLNTTTVAVAELIDELEKDGTIKGYGAKINWDNVKGSNTVTAYIELKVTPQMTNGFDRIAQRIYQFPQVTSLNLMSGSYDFGVTIEGDNLKEISLFVSQHLAPMESVISTATHFVLKRYKNDGVIYAGLPEDDREAIS